MVIWPPMEFMTMLRVRDVHNRPAEHLFPGMKDEAAPIFHIFVGGFILTAQVEQRQIEEGKKYVGESDDPKQGVPDPGAGIKNNKYQDD